MYVVDFFVCAVGMTQTEKQKMTAFWMTCTRMRMNDSTSTKSEKHAALNEAQVVSVARCHSHGQKISTVNVFCVSLYLSCRYSQISIQANHAS